MAKIAFDGARRAAGDVRASGGSALRDKVSLAIASPGLFRLGLAALVAIGHLSRIGTGRVAVALFFILSGYWISNLWNRTGGFQHMPKFLANRFFRIYPLYLIVVLICLMLFPIHITPSTFLLLGVASTEGPRAIGVEWSLDIEIEFYVLFPILYWVMSRTERSWVPIVAALTAFGWNVHAAYGIANVFQFLPMFATGMWLYREPRRFSVGMAFASLAAFVAFFFVCADISALRPQVILEGRARLINDDILGMGWAVLLIPYVGASLKKRSSNLDRMLGDSAYPLYLIHYPVFRLVEGILAPSLLTKAFSAIAAGIACACLYFFVDRPMESMRREALD
jgi:peptidoglycan/LPS O-acetylase OafA/YrhL